MRNRNALIESFLFVCLQSREAELKRCMVKDKIEMDRATSGEFPLLVAEALIFYLFSFLANEYLKKKLAADISRQCEGRPVKILSEF